MSTILYRSATLVRADTTGRTIFGLAVPYNRPTEVRDAYGPPYIEQFAPGAFARSIRERGSKIKLFGMHETRRFPIGRPEQLQEAADGLHVAFSVARTRDGDEALELVSTGVVDGFSVGFSGIRERRERDGTVTRIEASLREVSLVHSPAYEGAVIAGVRSDRVPLTTELAARRLAIRLKAW